ncbi:MAG: 7TM diverse intracellular signaling domain-containing protein [Cytophagales bacterium]|nr:SpoIIE family protein phosphatase [Bernardetiaceae bacterium]MDW8203443.1 7TM diverse intracellular signaling domain-containing protein [Cytophagales bacterium]
MRKPYFLPIMLLACLLHLLVKGKSRTWVLEVGASQVDLVPYALVLKDSSGKLTWQQVKAMDFGLPDERGLYFPHHNNCIYWIKLTIHNPYQVPVNRFLQIHNPTINRIGWYVVQKDKLLEERQTGDALPFYTRPVQNNYFIFPITLPANSTTEFFLRIDTESDAVNLPLVLWEARSLLESIQQERWIFGLFYGILLFTIVFHLFLFYKLNDTTILYYIGYVLGLGGFMLCMDGLAAQYLLPNLPALANSLLPFSASFGGVCLMIFSRKYLGRENLPVWSRWSLLAVGLLCALLMPFCFGSNEVITYAIIAASVIIPICSIVAVVAGIVAYRTDPLRAKYFTTAFIFLMGGVVLIAIKGFGLALGQWNEHGLKLGVATEVVIFAFAITVRFKQMEERTQALALSHLQNLNRMKDDYNRSLQEEVARRTAELSTANQKLTDSIRYAKRLQQAVLHSQADLLQIFPNSAVLDLPRDIVSGDFFWVENMGSKKILSVVDCTGHGAHGAFMSILGCRLFNEIAEQVVTECPAEWLMHLDRRFRRILLGDQDEELHAASMDVALLAYDEAACVVEYAGARRPLYLFRNGILQVYKGSPFAIGGTLSNKHSSPLFQKQRIEVQPGDILYLFSDGYADQFGGQPERKLTLERFRQILTTIHRVDIRQQAELLKYNLTEWQQTLPQTDDILVIALAIS